MSEHKLSAKRRLEIGKGPSRRLRMHDDLPAILSAKNDGAIPIVVCPKEVTKILRGPLRRNALIELELEGDAKKRIVMVKDRQIHPTRRVLTHVDFVEVDLTKPVVVSVPVTLSGKSESVVLGGKLDHVLQKMRVSCLPASIPQAINVDVTNLSFGSTHTKDVALPEGIKLAEKPRVVVLTIKKPRGAEKASEAEGEAPQPAKPAAAPAAAKTPAPKGK
ncbi:MAG TPA: 50S ribosomal protein L25 [Myxococcota bacterium]|nr:50S ribosomal protein L25 [Myxococcota bacterium]